MSFTNDTKNNTSFTNDALSTAPAGLTLDDMIIAIDEAEGTIDSPSDFWIKDTKNASSFTNDTKI